MTIRSARGKQDDGEEPADPFPAGSPHQVTELVLKAADVRMEEADRAPGEPLRAPERWLPHPDNRWHMP